MILVIDTTISSGFIVALITQSGGIVAKQSVRTQYSHGEKLTPVIVRLLETNKVIPRALNGIIVVQGPGRFSAVRAGVVTANTLAVAIGVPVVGVPPGSLEQVISTGLRAYKPKAKSHKPKHLVLPHYGLEPHISLQKTK